MTLRCRGTGLTLSSGVGEGARSQRSETLGRETSQTTL
jgi:hypothetical protein